MKVKNNTFNDISNNFNEEIIFIIQSMMQSMIAIIKISTSFN